MEQLSPGASIALYSLIRPLDDYFALDDGYLLYKYLHSRYSLHRNFHSHTQTMQVVEIL